MRLSRVVNGPAAHIHDYGAMLCDHFPACDTGDRDAVRGIGWVAQYMANEVTSNVQDGSGYQPNIAGSYGDSCDTSEDLNAYEAPLVSRDRVAVT